MGLYDRTLNNTGLGLTRKREQLGLTKIQAASQAGISRNDVARIESGNGGVTWRKVLPYLDLLGVELPKVIVTRDAGFCEDE